MNSYSYARNNPLRYSDPEGLWYQEVLTGQQSWSDFQIEVGQATQQMTQDSAMWNYAVDHYVTAGALTGVLSAPVGGAGVAGVVALKQVIYPGIGLTYATGKAVAGAAYLYLAQDSLRTISSVLGSMNSVNISNTKTYLSTLGTILTQIAPQLAGEKTQAVVDIFNLSSSIVNQFKRQLDKLNKANDKNKKKNK